MPRLGGSNLVMVIGCVIYVVLLDGAYKVGLPNDLFTPKKAWAKLKCSQGGLDILTN